jgi:hypothetical protein
MDTHDTLVGAQSETPCALDPRDVVRQRYRRFYDNHRDELRLKSHNRYYMKVHGMANAPPLRTNLKVSTSAKTTP